MGDVVTGDPAQDATTREATEVARLVEQARAGDQEAFARLYAGHVAAVRRYARRLVVHEHHVEDLVAEAFTRTWEQLALGKGPRVVFLAYMRAVVMNLHLSRLARDRRLRWVADIEDSPLADPELAARIAEQTPEHLVIQQLLNQRMKQALATLPHRHQLVLVKVYIEGAPYKEVAAHLELTVDATRQLALRARKAMRHVLADLSDAGHIAA